jgi:hypothetical protein
VLVSSLFFGRRNSGVECLGSKFRVAWVELSVRDDQGTFFNASAQQKKKPRVIASGSEPLKSMKKLRPIPGAH